MKPADIRTDYQKNYLDESQVARSPIVQFQHWFAEAQQKQVMEVNAMSLATVNAKNRPSVRVVLLKDIDERGFTFFTNYESRKGQDIASNPFASLLFFWAELERQVRIEGILEKIATEESDEYYHSRPLGSRIGAWASHQSSVIPNRNSLESSVKQYETEFGEQPPRPTHWGGYRLVPDRIEFWQGRSNRLHDRLEYRLQQEHWEIVRLAP